MTDVAVLHPGEMGASVAAALATAGHRVRWCAEGRSAATEQRAEAHGLARFADLVSTLDGADAVVSVCPPDAALDQARAVAEIGLAGTIYLDANAVAPATAEAIAGVVSSAGAVYVDGGIVGPPAWEHGTTRLYLSGAGAAGTADMFTPSPVEVIVIDGGIGAASALKMCFAASTKAVSAVLIAAAAAADGHGVLDELRSEWARRTPDQSARLDAMIAGTTAKAWRFSGEMAEIGSTFAAVGVPPGALTAAAELYGRLAPFKDGAVGAEPAAVLRAVLDGGGAIG